MASSYTALGVELQVTGENAGTWGDKTNTNLQLLQQILQLILHRYLIVFEYHQDLQKLLRRPLLVH